MTDNAKMFVVSSSEFHLSDLYSFREVMEDSKMRKMVIKIAKIIYLNTPYHSIRKIYFDFFCKFVRNREVFSSTDGINMKLNLGELIDVSIYLNKFEPDVKAAIEKLCHSGFTVFDIGANIGAHALRFSRITGNSGKVYAFEPTSYAFKKLVQNISLNSFGNIVPVQIALSESNLSQQRVCFRSSWPTSGKPNIQESIVDFVRLDDWVVRENIDRVDLIKLDVDGNEYSVIMGAKSLLLKQRPIILMEVWGPNFADPDKNPFGLLKQIGYRFFDIGMTKEYISVDELKSRVSKNEKLLDYSFNIVAKC